MGKLVSLSVASGAVLGLVALIRGRQQHTAWCRRLWALTAAEVIDLLRQDEVSPTQLIEALLVRIAATEPHINAVPTLCADRARAAARALARRGHPRNRPPGYLWGLPIVVKDLSAVAGVRWTSGSLAHAHRIPACTSIEVAHLEARGAIVIGKSNTPEFGAGSNTFNAVFGQTRNPFDTRLSAGGSSGGAAAALAAGGAWLATGSDLGGSLRIPASFCSVVGLRPTPGLIAREAEKSPTGAGACAGVGASAGAGAGAGEGASATQTSQLFSVHGPMARNVLDCALLLDAMCGGTVQGKVAEGWPAGVGRPAPTDRSFADEVRQALSLCHQDSCVHQCLANTTGACAQRDALPTRFAFSGDLGGVCVVDPDVLSVCRAAALWFAGGSAGAGGGAGGAGGAEDTTPAAVGDFAYPAAASGSNGGGGATTVSMGQCPDLSACEPCFRALRSELFAASLSATFLEQHAKVIKPEVLWNAADGLGLGLARPSSRRGGAGGDDGAWARWDVAAARREQARIIASTTRFFQEFEVLLTPCVMTPPFDVNVRYLSEVEGLHMRSYTEWLRMTYAITLTNCPAICIPAGATPSGMPCGLQLVGPQGSEAMLLRVAACFEAAHQQRLRGLGLSVPVDPVVGRGELPVVRGPRTSAEAAAHHRLID